MAMSVAVIVAHPDDETLWAGGLILSHPEWDWFICTLCRAGDPDRAPRFGRVLERYGARGTMADLDDAPEQEPLADELVQGTVLSLLPRRFFDLVLTHGPKGEYTRHRRHEEVSRAVALLWLEKRIQAERLWMFAYEDGGKQYLPRADARAHRTDILPEDMWQEKYRIVTGIYGFGPDTWEARTTPREEGFWCYDVAEDGTRPAAILRAATGPGDYEDSDAL